MPATLSNLEAEAAQAAIDRHRGRFVPWIIAGFYVTFMAALIGFVVIAYRNPPYETTTEAYEKGLSYDQTLAKAAASDALGWTSDIRYADGRVTFSVRDSQGDAVDSAQARVWFVHPADSAYDRSFDLVNLGGGVYGAAAPLPIKGLWTIHVTAALGENQYQTFTQIETK